MQQARDQGTPFALAMIDGQMPEMDGFTLAECIRRDPTLADCPIIMMTAAGGSPSAPLAHPLREAAYLTKPVKQSDLLDTILLLLGLRSRHRAAGQRHPRRASTTSLPSRRILLAEDNSVNQELAVAILKDHGDTVEIARNGREALAALAQREFDLILMDVQMPELGGLEATAIIRKKEKTTGTHIPIIGLTAHALKGDQERCLEAGMDAYLAKPIQPERLRRMVQDMVSPSRPDGRALNRAQTDQVLDGRALLAQVDGDVKLLGKLTQLFLSDCPGMLSALRNAIAAEDPLALQQAAHALKGAIANFSAQIPYKAALELEAKGRRKDLTGALEAFLTLEKEVGRLRRALVAVAGDKACKNRVPRQSRGSSRVQLKRPTRR